MSDAKKPTAGPWHVTQNVLETGLSGFVRSEEGSQVAEVDRREPGWEANARLIARAPTLCAIVDAVESLTSELEHSDSRFPSKSNKVRIAKRLRSILTTPQESR